MTQDLIIHRSQYRVNTWNRRGSQSGIIMFITMVAMLVMMIAGIALIRSFDTSLTLSGNLAFRRDLVIQGERGMAYAIQKLDPGGALASDTTRQANSTANNYYATILASDSNGIPNILSGKSAWTLGTTNDISTSGVTIRYVIDRMCVTGTTTESSSSCVSNVPQEPSTSSMEPTTANVATQTMYRISVRVSGPNNSQTFLQTTGYL